MGFEQGSGAVHGNEFAERYKCANLTAAFGPKLTIKPHLGVSPAAHGHLILPLSWIPGGLEAVLQLPPVLVDYGDYLRHGLFEGRRLC